MKFRYYIDSAHQLKDSDSLTTKKCLGLHGHTYAIDIWIKAEFLDDGFIIDFGKLKEILNEFDHKNLNEIIGENSTAEVLAHELFNKLTEEVASDAFGRKIEKVGVCEGYKGEDSANWIFYD